MNLTLDDKKRFIINTIYTAIIIGLIYLAFKHVLGWVMPFIIGFFIAYLLKPMADFIERSTKIKNKSVSIFVISFFYVVVIGVASFLVINLWRLIYEFINLFPTLYIDSIEPMIAAANDWIISFINNLSPEVAALISDVFDNVLSMVTQVVSSLSKIVLFSITGIAQKIPIYFITLLFSIICSVLITMDYDNVSAFLNRQIPKSIRSILSDVKKILVDTIFKMAKAYFILLFIAFIEMCIGFMILGIDHAIPIASIIAILDIIPLIGIGGILIPWGIYEIIIGQSTVGIGLLIIYLISYILRNTLEPKIVGKQIGLNSLVTFVSMFVGFKTFGFIGFMTAPIVAIIIKQLNDSNKIKFYH
ncbi:sporulation integral membrane protein YtvI [Alkaliphilus oremlandii]|uniref:Sporulation integral membrane protein YtvI n=1 Tax=Alkaliphilus oremlandii (strain OhILAs) TaxID=350688 RepID=A8MJC2_ALKOO|nr:sporulation integral membrane protein YtvI [Alkaliphilus oremlandii]ABW19904.1 Sporulation integral membrane protein YtvI [Alkaliphilus oremlandii OhILAs]